MLIGTWEFDGARTQKELQLNPHSPKALIECYKQKLCGVGVLVYDGEKWHQASTAISKVSDPEIPYTVIRNSKNQVEIETKIQDEKTKVMFHFINHDEKYIDHETGDYKWRDYFRRIR